MPFSQKPLVAVLLAAYNGERFLREQIDSLLAQTYTPLRILASDDGSTDGTWNLLEDYAARFNDRFTLMPKSAPTGSAKTNFRRLIQAVLTEEPDARYLAFSDQDDFWIPEKISLEMDAMKRMEQEHGGQTPLLVFSDLRLVGSELNQLHPSFWANQGINPTNIHRFRRLLAQNVVTGCTALINLPLASLSARMPNDAYMHDWWLALLATAFGNASIVPTQTVFYRQHGGNVLGSVEPPKTNLIPKFRYHKERRAQWEMAAHQAEALLRVHGAEMPPHRLKTLKAFLRCEQNPSRIVRVATFILGGFYFNTFRGNLAMLWYLWDMAAAKRDSPPKPR
jgi:glycosyltransferase involved in cell wall biosynthesis